MSRSRKGFTLVEILMAVCVAALLMTAASYLVMSFTNIWTKRTDEDAFEEHADGVTDFVQMALDESCSRYQPKWKAAADGSPRHSRKKGDTTAGDTDTAADTATSSSDTWTNAGVAMKKIDENDSLNPPLVHFNFFTMPPALGAGLPPGTPGVEAWLKFDTRHGLFIVWKDVWSIQETALTDEKELLRASPISPMVTRIDYIYWQTDTKVWKEYEEPHDFAGTYTLPDFLRLTFTEGDRSVTRIVRIPKRIPKMPTF